MKKMITVILSLSMIVLMSVPVSANEVHYYHGNLNSEHKCYARTTQTETDLIGAQITWQLSNSNTVNYGSLQTSTGYQVTSKSSNLSGKSGKSFGYYYHNTTASTSWQSLNWFSFSF